MVIDNNRKSGKTQELLKQVEDMLHKNRVLYFMNEEQLKNHNKEIINKFCQQLIDMLTDRAELIDFGYTSMFMFDLDDLKQSIDVLTEETK